MRQEEIQREFMSKVGVFQEDRVITAMEGRCGHI